MAPEAPAPGAPDLALERQLEECADRFGTPCYVYRLDDIVERVARLRSCFGDGVRVSFAVKANPNRGLLAALRPSLDRVDVSSAGELGRALDAGFAPGAITLTGPAKRDREITDAVACGAVVVCESLRDLDRLDEAAAAAGKRVPALLRVNPSRASSGYGIPMAGRPSQFGIDEEDLDGALETLDRRGSIRFVGFHVYCGSNALDAAAVTSSIADALEMFSEASARHDLPPEMVIIGPGFGIPYHPGEAPLDLDEVARGVAPAVSAARSRGPLSGAEVVLELGRWLVGPAGWMVARVAGRKRSRGVEIRLLDGGFNVHLAASGMLGGVLRRPWNMFAIGGAGRPVEKVMITGPLCTSLDLLASAIELPTLEVGHLVAIGASGAYGPTASPVGFIDHPVPREILVVGDRLREITEPGAGGGRR